jgi:hypothetical protein
MRKTNVYYLLGLILLLLALLPTTTIHASDPAEQQQAKSLTVGDVVKMFQNGIGDDVIIAKLNKEGKAFDLSADDLIELKKAGVSNSVLKAMMTSEPMPVTPAAAKSLAESRKDKPFCLYDGDKKIPLRLAKADMSTKMGALAIVSGSVSAFMTLSESGPKSDIRVTNRSPGFGELAIPLDKRVAEAVQLVKLELDPSKKHRRSQVAKGGGFRAVKMLDDMRIPITFEEIGQITFHGKEVRLYRAKPVAPLAPGEYAIVVSERSYFDFGVD